MFQSDRVYWEAAIDLVNTWSKYQGKKTLYTNASYPETYFRVKHVLDKYYDGDLKALERHKNLLSERVDEALAGFTNICESYGIETVSRKWLYDFLETAKDYQRLREKCRRRKEAGKPPQSLKDL